MNLMEKEMTTANNKVTKNTASAETVVKTKPETRIRDTDANNVWTIITIKDCEWCAKTIDLLKEHKETYKQVNMTHEWFRRLVVDYNIRRLPAIFLGNAYFGSYSELDAYYKCSFVSSKEVF